MRWDPRDNVVEVYAQMLELDCCSFLGNSLVTNYTKPYQWMLLIAHIS